MSTLQQYYDRRAHEYEQIYYRNDPLRQKEQSAIAAAMNEAFYQRKVLEIACGTGFWTEKILSSARQIVATDLSEEMLSVARSKQLAADKVKFTGADAYALEKVSGAFDAGLANFWLSHIPRARIAEFLENFHKRLGTGSVVFMADNVYIAGLGGELVIRSDTEDTFKLRELADGSKHEVLKNYYSASQLHTIFAPRAQKLHIEMGEYFWWVCYQL
jgi:SAM-dependent methyltransferase